ERAQRRRAIAHVEFQHRRLQLARERLGLLARLSAMHGDRKPLLRKAQRDRAADAAARTGDEHASHGATCSRRNAAKSGGSYTVTRAVASSASPCVMVLS